MGCIEKIALCLVIAVPLMAIPASGADAACTVRWVDHDFNAATPPIQKQICDSAIDLPAINLPGIQPIQRPQIRPLPAIGLPPLGTTNCSNQSVFENGVWVTRRLCN